MYRTALRRLAALLIFAAAPESILAAGRVEPRQPGERDACPVCGMPVARHPEWIAQVVFADSSAVFFDGAKDLFKYLLGREKYALDKRGLAIAAAFVTGYYELEPVAAAAAWYVVGSDVYGPMGHELVPLPTLAAAEEFLRDHGGTEIVRFADVTAELLAGLGAHQGHEPRR